jgi:hypothetical protein
MTAKTRTTPHSTRIGAVPKAAASRILARVQEVQGYQAMLAHLDPLADAVPRTNAALASQVRDLRQQVLAACDTARDNASSQAWALLQAQTGVARGNLVALQYPHTAHLLDAAPEVKEERFEVQSLSVAGPTADSFYFELQGTRLLKNGQPGKTPVSVPVRPGLTVTVLALCANDKLL